ncbi:hypothetical protein [Dysgonomonas termitidis]|jgi:hypothetical protein|uniref:DUF4134 domain-containing protein n=1 Tax=Dysgonomonas termitidis TaxID=1516126 RepID=A0ABV9KQQ6_9BACT
MEVYSILLYVSIAMFAASIVLWYISGRYIKEHKPALSRRMVYIGGFMFSFSILEALIALIIWSSK